MAYIRILISGIALFAFCGKGYAQNLVPNNSFEENSPCLEIVDWFSPTINSPDFFNSCGNPSLAGVPDNWFGFQYAKTGEGYAGIACFYLSPDGREYISVRLSDSLRKDKTYLVGFYISLAENSVRAMDNVGAYFSQSKIDSPTVNYIGYTPQVRSTPGILLNDMENWRLITGAFTANGGEQYITIGNFAPDSLTMSDTVNASGFNDLAYYYIDDVSVECVGADCPVGVRENEGGEEVEVFPNPTRGRLQVSCSSLQIIGIEIRNVLGELVFTNQQPVNGIPQQIDLSAAPAGIYFLKVQTKEGTVVRKIIKQ